MKTKPPLSHSQINMYKLCQRKWYNTYIKKIETDEEKSEVLIFGGLVHACIEQYLMTHYKTFGQELVDSIFIQKIVGFQWDEMISQHGKILPTELIDLVSRLVKQGLLTLSRDVSKIFILPNGKPGIEIFLQYWEVYCGVVDLMYFDKNGLLVLLDWKTTSWNYTHHMLKNSKQLIGYCWLCEQGDIVDYEQDGSVIFRQKMNIIPVYMAYGILHKRDKTAKIMKVKNTRQYEDLTNDIDETHTIMNNTINPPLTSKRTNAIPLTFFRKNSEACYSYNIQCPFYDQCWNEDTRTVEEVDLVPSLGNWGMK